MKNLFNMNNPFWTAIGRIFDVFILNCLWLLCCLPIITIGPSTTGLFYGMLGIIRGDGGYPSRDFFTSFRQNFKQGLQLGIFLTLLGAFLALDIYICYHAGKGIYTFFLFFFIVMFILWLAVSLFTFPLLAKFERTNKEILIWAFTLCIKYFARTFFMILVLAFSLWCCHIIPGLIFIAFGLAAETISAILAPILAPFLPEPFEAEAESISKSPDNSEITPIDDVNQWLL